MSFGKLFIRSFLRKMVATTATQTPPPNHLGGEWGTLQLSFGKLFIRSFLREMAGNGVHYKMSHFEASTLCFRSIVRNFSFVRKATATKYASLRQTLGMRETLKTTTYFDA